MYELELDREVAEILPARETMAVIGAITVTVPLNLAIGIQALTYKSTLTVIGTQVVFG